MQHDAGKWSLVCHLDYGGRGALSVIEQEDGNISARALPLAPATGRAPGARPVILGVTPEHRILLLDPSSKAVEAVAEVPEDAAALYAYPEPGTRRLWYTNDGDKETGTDTVNCGDRGASMTVAEWRGGEAVVHKILCVGRGHHVPVFTAPGAAHPDMPRRAFVSNLLDGTISVIGNDPRNPADYLDVLETINLCEPAREDGGGVRVPNNAFPHGQVYSPVTGKVYNLNNGYQTVAVIDPVRCEIEARIDFKVASNLLLSPDGRFIIGKGADRKADPDHVVGRLTVMDAVSGEIATVLDLRDVYPSTYRFNPDGSRLYVTTAATGKDRQRANLRKNSVLVYDSSALPEITLLREVEVGLADCGRRPLAFLTRGETVRHVFVPNPSDGTVSLLDGESDAVLETVRLSHEPIKELNFSFWGAENLYGC